MVPSRKVDTSRYGAVRRAHSPLAVPERLPHTRPCPTLPSFNITNCGRPCERLREAAGLVNGRLW
eukprot:6292900-Prymnesium_polylepis.1